MYPAGDCFPALSGLTVAVTGERVAPSCMHAPFPPYPPPPCNSGRPPVRRRGEKASLAAENAAGVFRAAAFLVLLVSALLLGLPTGRVEAQTAQTVGKDWALIPTGIGLGQSFRLLFITSAKTQATSSDIATYNSFVQDAAAGMHVDDIMDVDDIIRGMKDEFRAVACSQSTDAKSNTATTFTTSDPGVPIYWLNGAKVADDYGDFYDGSWDSSQSRHEKGLQGATTAFTGCNSDGSSHSSEYVGQSNVRTGFLALVLPYPSSEAPRRMN